MRRREFITLLGGAAAARPLAARAQQPERVRRIGVLMTVGRGRSRITASHDGVRAGAAGIGLDRRPQRAHRHPLERSDADLGRRYAAELVALAPDVILASGGTVVGALLQATAPCRSCSHSPLTGWRRFRREPGTAGRNATGFTGYEYGLSGKWLELLKEIAPRVTRAAVLRDATIPQGVGQFAIIQAAAASVGVEVSPIECARCRRDRARRRGFARSSNGGLIVTARRGRRSCIAN